MQKIKEILPGTIRIKVKDLKPYKKTKNSWVKINTEINDTISVVELFKAHDKFDVLIDTKNPMFLKGQLSPDEKCQGARINILPDGKRLDKAYSLFAKHLVVHDESSDNHWDAMYQNPGGTFAYCYSLEKKDYYLKKKYRMVDEFEKIYPELYKKVMKALNNKKDFYALPMYTLLKTYMRVGNEIYFKAHGHKGLTTLTKKNIKINGNNVTFKYLAKDGVPRNITETFPSSYIKRMEEKLSKLKNNAFVFVHENGHPLHDVHFKEAFRKYCGKEFYPHIVRSYYATKKTKEFLKNHDKITKEEMRDFFSHLATKLGHKKFDKKRREWTESYTVTVNHYIMPELVEKIKSRIIKNR